MIVGNKLSLLIKIFLSILIIVSASNISIGQSINLGSSKDNTLYEDAGGSISNGAGNYFFTGKTAGGLIRRGLISFNFNSIPKCATITSVTLTLHMSKTITGNRQVQLKRLTENWGEGTSSPGGEEGFGTTAGPGDATWLNTFYDTSFWARQGGTFSSDTSASKQVGAVEFYTWGSTAKMVSDVQSWLNNPSGNYGWLLLCDESTSITAKRFDTKENPVPANRPVLAVTYTNNSISLNLTSVIEGFWNGSKMVRDTVKVFLRNNSSPFGKVDSAKVVLDSLGKGVLCFPNASNGSYYIQVRHRNSIETWSKNPQSFATGTTTNYDFTTASTKAFGDNLILKLGKYCIYSGDVNQDGIIEGTDTQLIDNDVTAFTIGYVNADVNGDNFVDGTDASIAGNNAANFITSMIP